ncbi:hypothetical protein GE09DRAFT_1114746 [Coniochaeta sp. 2T2.1]|nr:hypothetical protein GE09DRAFT_1114746 [Coniochaeta sp. 2T2.1]
MRPLRRVKSRWFGWTVPLRNILLLVWKLYCRLDGRHRLDAASWEGRDLVCRRAYDIFPKLGTTFRSARLGRLFLPNFKGQSSLSTHTLSSGGKT